MSGPTCPCLFCNKATPMVGNLGRNSWGELGEVCPECAEAGIACDHKRFNEPRYWTGWRPKGEKRLSTVVQVYGNAGGKHEWPAAMGIDWATYDEIAEAIPPSYSEHIGRQLIAHLANEVAA